LIGFGTSLMGCGVGVRDESFVAPFRKALVLHSSEKDSEPISLAEFTDFEWDHLDIIHNGQSLSDVRERGLDRPKYLAVHTPQAGNYLWVFSLEGTVTRLATVVSHTSFDPENPIQDLPRALFEFSSLSREEAVFEYVRLDDSVVPERKHDYLLPSISHHRAESWRAAFLQCIKKSSFFDNWWAAATGLVPRGTDPNWPR